MYIWVCGNDVRLFIMNFSCLSACAAIHGRRTEAEEAACENVKGNTEIRKRTFLEKTSRSARE